LHEGKNDKLTIVKKLPCPCCRSIHQHAWALKPLFFLVFMTIERIKRISSPDGGHQIQKDHQPY
jgi:hypothetical protein